MRSKKNLETFVAVCEPHLIRDKKSARQIFFSTVSRLVRGARGKRLRLFPVPAGRNPMGLEAFSVPKIGIIATYPNPLS